MAFGWIDFLVCGFAYSAKLFAGTRHRLSGFEPAPPMRGGGVANIRDSRAAGAWWRWHSPAHPDHLALTTCVAHDWSRVIREYARHRRQVADVPIHHPEQGGDGGWVRGNRI